LNNLPSGEQSAASMLASLCWPCLAAGKGNTAELRGSPYRLPATKPTWKHAGGQVNHLGTVIMQQDWVIRSRAPCVYAHGEGSETRWQWAVPAHSLR